VPVGSVVRVTVAMPVELFTVAEARVVPLLTKLTVPLGLAVVTALLTVADSVTLVPGGTGVALLMLLMKVVLVGANATLTVTGVPVLPA
jgi:hypothetical protein